MTDSRKNPVLTAQQYEGLCVLMDTFFPSLDDGEVASILAGLDWRDPPKVEDTNMAVKCMKLSATEIGFPKALEDLFRRDVLSWEETFNFKLVLDMLNSRVGSAALCGSNPLKGSFVNLPRKEREVLLSNMSSSPIALQRKAFNDIKRVAFSIGLSFLPEDKTTNPLWESLGYSPIIQDDQYKDKQPWDEVDFKQHMVKVDKDMEVEVDVVVIGSGAGGGVCAATLSQQGYRVLVLDKAQFIPPKEMTTLEKDGFEKMYEKAGLLTTSDGSMAILAGSALGGGTSINWGCCIPTPDYVRKEWSEQAGLSQFQQNSSFDKSLNAIWERISAKEVTCHNRSNSALLEGCEILGLDGGNLANNMKDPTDDAAGWTCFGDRWGNKQTGLFTYLADAAKTGNCSFIDCCEVKHVTCDEVKNGQRKRANGVSARVLNQSSSTREYFNLTVKAKHAVVVAAGSIHSPCVLLRSQIGVENCHVGKHLKLHPVSAAIGRFEGEEVKMYAKAPMTAICRDGMMGPANNGFGARLECPSVHPGLMGACLPWQSAIEAKAALLELKTNTAIIALQRDVGEGQVCLSTDGLRRYLPEADDMATPLVHYLVDKRDEASLKQSVFTAMRVLAAAGATHVLSLHSPNYKIALSMKQFSTSASKKGYVETTEIKAELTSLRKKIDTIGFPQHGVGLFSAHQMGTCRMGVDPLTSVVDCDGESWDRDNLYVMDASVFPSASGANPMVTTLAISHLLSHRLADRLNTEQGLKEAVNKDLLKTRDNRRSNALKKQRACRLYGNVQYYLLTPLFLVATSGVITKIAKQYSR